MLPLSVSVAVLYCGVFVQSILDVSPHESYILMMAVFVSVHQSSSGKLLQPYLCNVLTICAARTVNKNPAAMVLTSMCKTVAFQTTKM